MSEFYNTGDDTVTRPLTSLISYLIGVPKKTFSEETYVKYARIFQLRRVRNLCALRNRIFSDFQSINKEYRNATAISEIKDIAYTIEKLGKDNIVIEKTQDESLSKFLIRIEELIRHHIEEVKFPDIVPEQWLKDLFSIPSGDTVVGIRNARDTYKTNKNLYPYQCYMHWDFSLSDETVLSKNILCDDDLFITELNKRHMPATRTESGKEFLENAGSICVLIDAENSDPIPLYGMISDMADKISHVYIIDDIHTTIMWKDFEDLLVENGVNVTRERAERINPHKSMVDYHLVIKGSSEYEQGIRNFLIATSDSDMWSFVITHPDANVVFAMEKAKSGIYLIESCKNENVPIWWLEPYQPEISPVKCKAVERTFEDILLRDYAVNINEVLDKVAQELWIDRKDAEFYKDTALQNITLFKDPSEGILTLSARRIEDPDCVEAVIEADTEENTETGETSSPDTNLGNPPEYTPPRKKGAVKIPKKNVPAKKKKKKKR